MSAGDDDWRQYIEDDGFLSQSELRDARRNLTPSALQRLGQWARSNTDSVSESIGGGLLSGIADGTIGTAVDSAVSVVLSTLFTPLYKGIFLLFAILASVAAVGFLGTDLALADTVHGLPGIADMPILFAQMTLDAAAPVGAAILEGITALNGQLIETVSTSTGLAAAPLLVGLQALELGVLLFLADLGRQAGRSLLPI